MKGSDGLIFVKDKRMENLDICVVPVSVTDNDCGV